MKEEIEIRDNEVFFHNNFFINVVCIEIKNLQAIRNKLNIKASRGWNNYEDTSKIINFYFKNKSDSKRELECKQLELQNERLLMNINKEKGELITKEDALNQYGSHISSILNFIKLMPHVISNGVNPTAPNVAKEVLTHHIQTFLTNAKKGDLKFVESSLNQYILTIIDDEKTDESTKLKNIKDLLNV